MAANRIHYLFLLFCVTLFYIFFDGYLSFYVLVLALCLPGVSLLLSLPMWATVWAGCRLGAASTQSGKPLPAIVEVGCGFPLGGGRVRVCLLIENRLTGEKNREALYVTPWTRPVTVEHKLSSQYCGELTCEISELRCYDFLGLFSYRKKLLRNLRCSVLCYPRISRVFPVVQPVSGSFQEGERYSPYRPGDDPTELFGLREYVEGDKLSRVDWKLSAKLQKTMVKETSLPLSSHLLFYVAAGGTGAEVDLLYCAFASLAVVLLDTDVPFAVSFCGPTGREQREVTCEAELTELWPLLLSGSPKGEEGGTEPFGSITHLVVLAAEAERPLCESLGEGLMGGAGFTLLRAREGESVGLDGVEEIFLCREALETCLQGLVL